MKTFTKKSLSIVLAVLMALSTLTIGGFSAFAAEGDVTITPYSDGVTSSEAGDKYYSYSVAKTGYYAVAAEVAEIAADAGSAYANVQVYSQTDNQDSDYGYTTINGVKYNYVARASTVWTNVYSVVNNKLSDAKKAYMPAYSTVELEASKNYLIKVTTDENTTSKLTIAATDFDVAFESYSEKLTHTNDDGDTVKENKTVGIMARINSYYGNDTSIAVPATVAGVPVKSVNLNVENSAIRKRVTSVAIPEGVEAIGGMSGMYALSSVNLPASLKSIDFSAFAGDHALGGKIVLGDKVEYVGSDAFYDTAVTAVEVKNVETQIGEYAFGYKEVLNEATANPNDTTSAPVDGFMVIAPAASLATRYAINNGFAAYDPANCAIGAHPYALTATKAATLFTKGSNTYTCPVCGAVKTEAIAKATFAIKASAKKGQITVKAAKLAGVTGYQIQYSTSKKFKKKTTKTVKVTSKKALNKTIKGLKKGKYYVRVRACKGKKTGVWTKVKAVKVK